jgi:hypothetical protein
VPWHGRIDNGPNWSKAKQRSGNRLVTSSIRSSLTSLSGSLDSFQVLVRWKEIPCARIAGDTSRYPEWVEGTLRMIHTNGPIRVGATYEELTRIAGPWKSVTRWRVTEWDPPRRQVHQGEGISTSKDTAVIIELSPAGQDTNFTLTVR